MSVDTVVHQDAIQAIREMVDNGYRLVFESNAESMVISAVKNQRMRVTRFIPFACSSYGAEIANETLATEIVDISESIRSGSFL